MNRTREEIRLLIGALRDLTANQPQLPAIYPDYEAPIVRLENGERIIANARWGLPSPAFALRGRASQIVRIEQGLLKPVLLVGNLDACRDFLDVRDIVAAYVAVIMRPAQFDPGQILNLASGKPRRIGDILEQLVA